MNNFTKKINSTWFNVFISTAGVLYLYVFMEWVFFVTKTSFMIGMHFTQQVIIFLLSAFILALPFLLILLILTIIATIVRHKGAKKIIIGLAIVIPAIVVACLVFMLIDNFTYTLIKIGVVTSSGFMRAAYALLFILLSGATYLFLWRWLISKGDAKKKYILQKILVTLLLVLSFIIAVSQLLKANVIAEINLPSQRTPRTSLPNIILLSSDGLSATELSIYGYARDTTPNMRRLIGKALVAENAFANSGNTGGSLIAVLTGKSPLQTRLYFPPDILVGLDSYQHLPGILKEMGYYTVQLSDAYYADAYTVNLRNGFDEANDRTEFNTIFTALGGYIGDGGTTYFTYLILQRLSERLQHAFYLHTMVNPYIEASKPGSGLTSEKQIEEIISILDNATTPVFMQVHMEGTHGEMFSPIHSTFSAGKTQDKAWMPDFLDDAILDFDENVKRLFEHLSRTGKLNNTIIVIYSDHGMVWNTTARIPLLIWFPKGEHSGVIKQNVQLLDIAPTLLDYLGVAQPDWMSGTSLLKNIPARYIIAPITIATERNTTGDWIGYYSATMKPPFYEIGANNLIACNKYFTLFLESQDFISGEVIGSTLSCDSDEIPSSEQAIRIILSELRKNGYDTSSFPDEPLMTSTSPP